jgi:polyisoprenoid-binding protein YceI
MNMKRTLITLLAIGSLTGLAPAGPLTFDFKDPKGVNNAAFKLDAPLESVNGSANGISGTVEFDPANPAATTGTLVVDTKTLMVPNPMMKNHLHSDLWMDTARYGEITFAAKSLKNVKTDNNTTTAEVTGALTIKNVTKDVTIPVKFTYLKDKLGQRVPNLKGDLLVIRSNFTIKRSDYNINPGQMEDKVSDEIALTLSIAGAAPGK